MTLQKLKDNSSGFAAIFVLLILMTLALAVTYSLSAVINTRISISSIMLKSAQSYYSAESGIEDALLRVMKGYNYTAINDFVLVDSDINQTITQNGNITTIESLSSHFNHLRKVKTEITLSSTVAQFHYGVQVGAGGLEMAQTGSTIHGNLYSDGPVIEVGKGNATVTESLIVSGFNSLDGITVGVDAYANAIVDSEIGGDAYYQTISGSTVGGTSYPEYPNSPELGMPFTDAEIDSFKADAAAFGTLDPSLCSLSSDTTINGGKIVCPTGFDTNNNDLILNGTLWVVGDVTLGSDIILGSGYGKSSGMIIADDPLNTSTKGKILINNAVRVCGSAGCGFNNDTYIMLLSTHSGIGTSYAIDVRNTADGAITYSAHGIIFLKNNANVKEAIAYKLVTSNNTDVYYEDGLANVNFISGPGRGWVVNSWIEIE
ncbi:hypothetical protein K0B03_04285 [Patescibacteria group bacterium]|nr:hypothetical protein [Patescibacteria group bacterium]